ncbi:MAG: GntR family transcriptional regulator [Ruminococcaceae bacterium]|nr:GntR family transcriptional regulator [Oscillospiraceae bacterium]
MIHKTISLADQVYEQLETDILTGKYQRGEVLTELKLCETLGVSRTPVREALRRLADEHIIEEGTRGCIVLGISKEDLCDIYEIRCEIEGMAAARAAEKINEEQISKIKELIDLQEFYAAKKNAASLETIDKEFHQLIYRISGSNTIYNTLMPLHKKIQKYRKSSVENEIRAEHSYEEHKAIYEALKNKDSNLARAKMTEHVKNAYKHIIKE